MLYLLALDRPPFTRVLGGLLSLALLVASTLAACGGATSDASTAPVIGSFDGEPFVVRSVWARESAPADAGGGYLAISVFLTTENGSACCMVHPNAMAVALDLVNVTGQTPIGPGTYPLGATTTAGIAGAFYFWRYGSTCADREGSLSWPDGGAEVLSGTLTLTSVAPTIQGSFDVIENERHFTGSLNASLCEATTPAPNGDYCSDGPDANACAPQ
jgi:hypothetical protein